MYIEEGLNKIQLVYPTSAMLPQLIQTSENSLLFYKNQNKKIEITNTNKKIM